MDLEKRQLMTQLTVQIKNAGMGLISFAAEHAFKNYKEEEFLKMLNDELQPVVLETPMREVLGVDLSSQIGELFK